MNDFPPLPGVPLPATVDRIDWQRQRRDGIGSSDASAILGLSNYASAYSLWEEKTGRAPLDTPVSPEMERLRHFGHVMEPVISRLTADELGIGIHKPEDAVHHRDYPWLRCNLDGWTSDGRIAEFKNVHQSQAALWDGQIPDHAEVQVTHSGIVLEVDEAVVAGLIGGNRLAVHEVVISATVKEILFEAESKFWEHVEADTPPAVDDHEETVRAVMREWEHRPGAKQVDEIDVQEWHELYFDAHSRELEAAKDKRRARANIAALMDGHESLATGTVVWATTRRGQLDRTRLEHEQPDVFARFVRPKEMFDLEEFKRAEPALYDKYRSTSVMPKRYATE